MKFLFILCFVMASSSSSYWNSISGYWNNFKGKLYHFFNKSSVDTYDYDRAAREDALLIKKDINYYMRPFYNYYRPTGLRYAEDLIKGAFDENSKTEEGELLRQVFAVKLYLDRLIGMINLLYKESYQAYSDNISGKKIQYLNNLVKQLRTDLDTFFLNTIWNKVNFRGSINTKFEEVLYKEIKKLYDEEIQKTYDGFEQKITERYINKDNGHLNLSVEKQLIDVNFMKNVRVLIKKNA